jgi:hypothetical protein
MGGGTGAPEADTGTADSGSSSGNSSDDGFGQLQALIVGPEVVKLQQQMVQAERQIVAVEQKVAKETAEAKQQIVAVEQKAAKETAEAKQQIVAVEQKAARDIAEAERQIVEVEQKAARDIEQLATELKQQLRGLENKVEHSEQLIKILLSLLNKLMDFKLAQFRQQFKSDLEHYLQQYVSSCLTPQLSELEVTLKGDFQVEVSHLLNVKLVDLRQELEQDFRKIILQEVSQLFQERTIEDRVLSIQITGTDAND